MKKLALFITLLVFLTASCSKSVDNSSTDENTQSKLKSTKTLNVTITCTGTCDEGGRCRVIIKPGNNYAECGCEGCVLVVNELKADGYIVPDNQQELKNEIFSKNMFVENLEAFVLKKHKTKAFDITSIEYVQNGEEYYFIYDLEISGGVYESVMYAYTYSKNLKSTDGGVVMRGFEIDCSGECNDATETCRERYTFNPPGAECTCAGSCSMVVNEL